MIYLKYRYGRLTAIVIRKISNIFENTFRDMFRKRQTQYSGAVIVSQSRHAMVTCQESFAHYHRHAFHHITFSYPASLGQPVQEFFLRQ